MIFLRRNKEKSLIKVTHVTWAWWKGLPAVEHEKGSGGRQFIHYSFINLKEGVEVQLP